MRRFGDYYPLLVAVLCAAIVWFLRPWVPPEHGAVFTILTLLAGGLTYALAASHRLRVRGWTQARTRRRLQVAIALVVGCAGALFIVDEVTIVTKEGRGTVFYPLWIGGELEDLVDEAGSREAAIDEVGRAAVQDLVDASPLFPRIVTLLVLVVLHVAFWSGIIAILSATNVRGRREKREPLDVAKLMSKLEEHATDDARPALDELAASAARPDAAKRCSVFLSYSSQDEELAKQLYEKLSDYGFFVWFAPASMRGGAEFFEQIKEAIEESDRVVVLLSPHSIKSDWVKREVYRALAVDAARKRRRNILFPVSIMPRAELRAWVWPDMETDRDLALIVRKYHIPLLRGWEDADSLDGMVVALARELPL